MKALSRRAFPVHLPAMLLAIAAPSLLHAGREAVEPGRTQSVNIHEASSRPESQSVEDGRARDDPHSHAVPETTDAPEGGWASDAPLRQGMQAILNAVVAAVRNGGEGKALASELRAQIRYLFANCRLEPEADAALHAILADVLQSAQRLDDGASAKDEHDALHAALRTYGQRFQHPGWPLR